MVITCVLLSPKRSNKATLYKKIHMATKPVKEITTVDELRNLLVEKNVVSLQDSASLVKTENVSFIGVTTTTAILLDSKQLSSLARHKVGVHYFKRNLEFFYPAK